MSKLISEEIVEAITLGDKEGFMSAFQSALAAKVSDALEIKKVEIASTLIAPASSEVVEEEVEQTDEAVRIYDRLRSKIDPQHGEKGTFQGEMERLHMAAAARDRRRITKGYGVKGFNSAMLKPKTGSLDTSFVRAKKTNEEVEQIDELSKGTLASYITKAAPKIRSNTFLKGHFEGQKYGHLKTVRKHSPNVNPNRKHERDPKKKEYAELLAKSAGDVSDKFALKAKNKITGIQRAAAKLAKEEVEEIDEAKKSETRISWRSRTPEEIAKSDKRRKVKITSAELEARARARRGEKSE